MQVFEYEPGFIHAKNFVVDDLWATVGTVNLDYRSMFLHFENGVLLYAEEPGGISGVTFDGVSLRLRRATDYETGLHDLRPCAGPACTEKKSCWVYAKNASRTVFRNCAFHEDGTMGLPQDAPCCCEDCRDFRLEEG